MKPREQILTVVQIRGAEAVWVLAAPAYAVFVPVALCIGINYYWDYLGTVTQHPWLFYVAASLLASGSAFEVAQNSIDNWYLTGETASANGVGFCDFLFYWLIVGGQVVSAVAIAGDTWWVLAIGGAAVLALPFLYFINGPYFAPLMVSSLLSIGLAFRAFGDPLIFLQLLLAGATVYFFEALLRTGAQSLHGVTTMCASSGVWLFLIAVGNGAAGTPTSWVTLGIITALAAVAGVLLWPVLTRLPASERAAPPSTELMRAAQ